MACAHRDHCGRVHRDPLCPRSQASFAASLRAAWDSLRSHSSRLASLDSSAQCSTRMPPSMADKQFS